MTSYRSWTIAALVIAVLFYLWDGEDEPEPEQSTQQKSQSELSSSYVRQSEAYQAPLWSGYGGYPPPADPNSGYSMGYTMPGESSPTQYSAPGTGGYRFRQRNDMDTNGNRLESPYPLTQPGQNYPTTSPAQRFQDLPGYNMVQQPDNTYRFRPLDKKRQAKRWSGNYGPMRINPSAQPSSPYAYDRYPVPSYPTQPSSEPNPLWANSWPDR